MLAWGDHDSAHQMARMWRRHQPSSVLPLVALGVVAEYVDDEELAGRAYGSLVDLYPSEVDARRLTARQLERLGASARRTASDVLAGALLRAPDNFGTRRELAMQLLSRGDYAGAVTQLSSLRESQAVLALGEDRFGVVRAIEAEMSLVLGGWRAAVPASVSGVEALAAELGVPIARVSGEVIVLTWDGAHADLDLHVRDERGEHAYYRRLRLPGGGVLSGDGRGRLPYEAFSFTSGPGVEEVDVAVHANGPMGLTSGSLDVLRFVPGEGLTVHRVPFITTRPRADLGLTVRSDLAVAATVVGTPSKRQTPKARLMGRRGPDGTSLH